MEGGGKGGEEKTEQNRKIGYVGKGGGVAVWRFQFLPFARKPPPCLTLTFFDFRLVKKGKGLRPPPFLLLCTDSPPVAKHRPVKPVFTNRFKIGHFLSRCTDILKIDIFAACF